MDRLKNLAGLLGQPQGGGLLGEPPQTLAALMNPNLRKQGATIRALMAPPTSVMDERYPAWKKSQDDADKFLLAADVVGSALPLSVLAAPQMKKGLFALGEAAAPRVENYMARTGLLQPATVWHGSPHKFDKFDASKIGTGEGAQAFGHGLYFADNPGVASTYTGGAGDIYGMSVKRDNGKYHAAAFSHSDPKFRKESYFDSDSDANRWIREQSGGNLYKVDLPDEAIAKMLDWDKPLSQQAPEVQAAIFGDIDNAIANTKKALANASQRRAPTTAAELEKLQREKARLANLTGEDFYKQQALGVSSGKPVAADSLKSLGIPGIRYLDGGSRGSGAGTSNYVVFPGNENLLKILSRE